MIPYEVYTTHFPLNRTILKKNPINLVKLLGKKKQNYKAPVIKRTVWRVKYLSAVIRVKH